MRMTNNELSKIFKVLADPKRLSIIEMLSTGEKCACKLLEAFNITQPTLSHDMKLMCDVGLTIPRREGKWTHYSLNEEKFAEVKAAFEMLTVPHDFEAEK